MLQGGATLTEIEAAIAHPHRLAALRDASLLDTPPEEAFDQLARMASRLLDAPVALVSLVDRDRQFFKACIGDMPEPYRSERATPISHSFCRYAVASREPLLIEDARTHPLVKDNPAIHDLGVVAYAGFPLVDATGQALGTLCVVDSRPRQWSIEQVQNLGALAALTVQTIAYRSAAKAAAAALDEPGPGPRSPDGVGALAGAVETHLTALNTYQRALECAATSGRDLDEEARLRARVLATEAEARQAAAAQQLEPPASSATANAGPEQAVLGLAEACAAYFAALDRRAAAMERFQRLEATLEEVERTAASALGAEQALRLAARACRIAGA